MSLQFLQNKLAKVPQENYPVTSRIHPLNSLNCFVKRDDELGFGISGTKYRKYRTLIPFLREQGCEEIALLGNPYSNHVLGISQLLVENGLNPILFLKGAKPTEPKGNFYYLQKIIPESQMHFIPKAEWNAVATTAQAPNRYVLEEGAPLFSSFLGALTLPLDIVRNEQEHGLVFDHLFMEVGTGISAVALLLGYAFLQKTTHCHLLLMADGEAAFRKVLVQMHAEFEAWLGHPCPLPQHFTCAYPSKAKSFGSTNTELIDFITEMGQKEGFFLDPIYSGKLFYHAREQIAQEKLQGNILLLHSGGALSLCGFCD